MRLANLFSNINTISSNPFKIYRQVLTFSLYKQKKTRYKIENLTNLLVKSSHVSFYIRSTNFV